jgi:hypothetical protein
MFEPNDMIDSFMLHARTCFNSLQGIYMEIRIHLLALCCINKSQFPGIHCNLLAFKSAFMQADLNEITNCLHCKKGLEISSMKMIPKIYKDKSHL